MNLCRLVVLTLGFIVTPIQTLATEQQTVAVIGTGDMGDSLGLRFAELGYRVVHGSRDPASDKVQALVELTGPNTSDDREAKEIVAGIVAAMGMDPVDVGPLRMAREIESLQMIYMIPLVQVRDEAWEFYFRRSNHWPCQDIEGWYEPVYDNENLATLPGTQGDPLPCAQ